MHEPTAKPAPERIADPAAVLGAAFQVLPAASRLVFQGAADARTAAARCWKPGFSQVACRAATDGESASLWLGPDEFLLISPGDVSPGDASALQISLADSMAGIPHSLVDVSHRQLGFELRGADAAVWLSGGCPLDLHLSAFPIGMCTRTVFAKADIVLWRKAAEVFHVEVWRSFFEYTTQLLAEIARS